MFVREGDDGRTVTVRRGDRVEIRLPENPTTGYLWEAAELDAIIAPLVESRFNSSTCALTGGGGERVLVLEARTPGRSAVRMCLVRPWLGPTSAIKTFSLNLVVL